MTESILQQTERFYKILKGESEVSIIDNVDELLALLYKISDSAKNSSSFVIYNQLLTDIIYGLESNPVFFIQQLEVQEKLLLLFRKLLGVK